MDFIRIYLGVCCLLGALLLIWMELDKVDVEDFYNDKDEE